MQFNNSYETKMSGIGETQHHENVWYHKTVSVKAEALQGHVLLHFEGSDFETRVWVNGNFIGSHRGGYTRFSFDITGYLKEGENDITVKAEDSMSIAQPRGKQRWAKDNYACWYVQTTGIWKTVWLETVPGTYLENVRITPCLKDGTVSFEYYVAAAGKEEDLWIDTAEAYEDRGRTFPLLVRRERHAGLERDGCRV